MANNSGTGGFIRRRVFLFVAAVPVLVLISIGAVKFRSSRNAGSSTGEHATFVVKRGPLRISVTESGTIKAREQVILKSEVEGRTSILWLIPEGTRVKQGALLVELDASQLVDNRIDQQIIVQNAEAAFIGARENLAVVENQAQSDIDLAELTLKFAEQDLQKYLEGEYPNQLREAQSQITLAEEELKRAEEKLKWSRKLFEEKYISQTELQADELAAKKATFDLELAKNNLDLLEKYTNQRDLDQLESDVRQAQMALERTRRKAKADVAQAEADLKAKESEYNRQQDKLKKTEEQIEKTKIYAPADGLAIYATSARSGGWRSSREPMDVGQDVQERQELIYLPTGASATAEVDIHEASLEKVEVGLPAIVTVDALQGKTYVGSVARIAPLPDAQSRWLNPDLKVYNTEVYLDANDSSLRTGMSCKAEIIIEQYENEVYIPVQAVLRVGGETTVYVVNDKMVEPRRVEIGMDNNRMVRIIDGLQEGEVVLLTPPLKAGTVGQPEGKIAAETVPFENHTEEIYMRVNEKLEQRANGVEGAGQDMRETDNREQRRRGRSRPGDSGSESMGRGQRRKRERRPENMSAEEMEKVRERFKNMSPEEREKMRRQRRGETDK
ncbi:MAG: efflux RND transporter periplasmic adaptor subunit [Planctomycetota bacterium]|jgi:HlyD family secretion protein